MKIDILSDLHIDQYFSNIVQEDAVTSIFSLIFTDNGKTKPADILVVAGDIGHNNLQNLEVLKIFQKNYYKYIVCVLGNHDYYLIDNKQKEQYNFNSFNRAKEMTELINSTPNMYCLDGDVIEIDGVKFGGCTSWYDNAYMKKYYPNITEHETNQEWQQHNRDAKFIYGIDNYNDIKKIEINKIENIYQKCDIMVTHVNPSFLHQHINSAYLNNKSNTFFTSNCHKYLQKGHMKYWLFGHTHDIIEYDLYDVKCICNPFGTPIESYYGEWIWIKSIEI